MGALTPVPDAICDGGDLDCGSGLLLIIRNEMQPLSPGGVLEVRSREVSVKEDLPSWCRMVGHTMLETVPGENRYTSYFISKRHEDAELSDDLRRAKDFSWRVRARWAGGMSARAFARNHSFEVGQPASFETEDPAPSAVEYLLASLAGCLAVGFQWRASSKGIEVRHVEVSLSARADNILVFLGMQDEGSPGFALLEGKVYVDADADEPVLRELWEQTVKRSPVAQSLVRNVRLDLPLRCV
ncbi:MAG: sulfurtransferase TusA family protein [Actinomycetota bacterium]